MSIERFFNPGQSGTCPVTEMSGKRRTIRFRRACDKDFRNFTQQWASPHEQHLTGTVSDPTVHPLNTPIAVLLIAGWLWPGSYGKTVNSTMKTFFSNMQ